MKIMNFIKALLNQPYEILYHFIQIFSNFISLKNSLFTIDSSKINNRSNNNHTENRNVNNYPEKPR